MLRSIAFAYNLVAVTNSDREFQAILKKLGSSIREKRLAAGLTQEDMEDSEKFGIDVKYIQRIESGRNITLRTLHKISKRLGIPLQKLFDFK